MEDRELLERAASAAGVDVRWVDSWKGYFIHQPHKLPNMWPSWNPLTDDGDALRLAVKMRLNINFEEWDGAEYACAVPNKSHQGWDEVINDDESAATRRAIVRAAAALAAPHQTDKGD